jgi:hypothetical protein
MNLLHARDIFRGAISEILIEMSGMASKRMFFMNTFS